MSEDYSVFLLREVNDDFYGVCVVSYLSGFGIESPCYCTATLASVKHTVATVIGGGAISCGMSVSQLGERAVAENLGEAERDVDVENGRCRADVTVGQVDVMVLIHA